MGKAINILRYIFVILFMLIGAVLLIDTVKVKTSNTDIYHGNDVPSYKFGIGAVIAIITAFLLIPSEPK